jgi:Cft2 family RNA processing exonuclease
LNFSYIKELFTLEEYYQLIFDKDAPRVFVTSMSSLELGFSRKMIKDFISKPKNELIFMQQQQQQQSEQSSSSSRSLGWQLLNEGAREVVLPDECQVMGILDDSGENYMGAQRRESMENTLQP